VTAQPRNYRTLDIFLKDAVQGVLTPILYFDTNVFLDIIDKRDAGSLCLYEYVWQQKWQCVTSIFARVEVLEVKQFHQFKKEKQAINWSAKRVKKELHRRDLHPRTLGNISRSLTARLKFRCEGFNQYSCLVEDGWVKAEEVKRKTNLTDKDSIHLAEALAIACDIFITRDNFLLSIANKYIWAEPPDSMIRILKSVGAQV
jgi:predicted nucleic acid-binding protein